MHRSRGFTLIELVVSIAVIGILISIILPAIQAARNAGRKLECANHLKQLSLAMLNYEARHHSLPPFTVPNSYSAWAHLLPDLEMKSLFRQINFSLPYSIGGGTPLVAASSLESSNPLPILECPSDSSSKPPGANYGVNWGGSGLLAEPNGVFRSAILGPSRLSEVRDGLSHTALVSEWIRGSNQFVPMVSAVDRTEPLALVFNLLPGSSTQSDFPLLASQCRSLDTATAFILFSNRGLQWLEGSPWQSGYNHLATPNSNTCANNGDSRGGALSAASYHSGGVNVALADGAVRFVTSTIDVSIWRSLGSRNGSESNHAF